MAVLALGPCGDLLYFLDLPNFRPKSPDREILRSVCEPGTSHRTLSGIVGFSVRGRHETKAVKSVWLWVLGLVVHDIPGGDACKFAHGQVSSGGLERVGFHRFAANGHCVTISEFVFLVRQHSYSCLMD